jgi:membrane associated rhomboid family serine protease
MLFPIGDDTSSKRTVPVVTYGLIALNALVFFMEMSQGEPFIRRWSVVPRHLAANPSAEFVTVFTAMFMHAGWMHLLGNMLFLWIFGDNVESKSEHVTIGTGSNFLVYQFVTKHLEYSKATAYARSKDT